jgi:F-type H+-transporting ATPase subunit alpha
MNKENGGGSITALPIIETQANDISAYIPTNVISITDGQIFLQPDLFNAGVRPAIDAGNSVSRVGGSAQTSTIKSLAGRLRLEIAQYNNLAAFAQFGSDLDEATAKQLERGKRTVEILKQPQYNPLAEPLEYLSVWLVTSGTLDNVTIENVTRFETEFHDYMVRKEAKLLDELSTGQKPTEELLKKIEKAAEGFKKSFS